MARDAVKSFWTLLLLLSVTAISAAPMTVITPDVEEVTLSTELKPPPEDKEHQYVLFVINLIGVKNVSGETSEEIVENEVVQNVPEIIEPIATLLLLIELDNDGEETNTSVDLDEIADSLRENEGLDVEKMNYGGETQALRLKLDKRDMESVVSPKMEFSKMKNIRSKRTICLSCSGGGGGGPKGGGCGPGGCGGGGYPGGSYPGGGGGYPGGGYPGGGGGYPGGGGGGYPGGGGGYPGGGGGGGGYPGGGCGPGGCGGGGGGGYPGGGGHGGQGGCSTCGGGGGASYASAQSKAVAYG